MTDKEKIKTEIERLFSENRKRCSVEGYAAVEQLRKILAFINSLPEEPVSEDSKKAYTIGYRQAIKDACDWIKQQQDMLEDCFSDAGDFADLLKEAIKR